VISILTLFIVIAASRPVNKNVHTGAVTYKSKTRYRSSRAFINYWRTIKPVVTSSGRAAGTEQSDLSLTAKNAVTKFTQAWRRN